ncbi:MAG TPA: hypothetical protein VF575_04620 [Candidatus Saccharimonadales bacterium]|jgi:hypothetical protein
MTKHKATAYIGTLKAAKPVYFLTAAAISSIVCINGLRTNNLTMVTLRSDVYQADKDNGDVRGALTELQQYVTSHMNTDLTPGRNAVYPPIQLKYTYERLQAANNSQLSNEQIYNDAQKHCEGLNSTDFSGRNRVPCIQEYVSTHGANAPKTIPDSLYKYDFVSPSWSPDVAGWSLLATITLLVTSVALWVARRLFIRR